MQNLKIDGIGKFNGGEYGNVKIDGIAQCEGEIKAESIEIDGKFKCIGKITADSLECDGMAEIKADVVAKKISINGHFSVKSGSKLYAEDINCDGFLSIDGQLSADSIFIDGLVYAKEIVGDNVTVNSNLNAFTKLFIKKASKADLIEATTIELRGVTANAVNGNNIIIREDCEIGSIDCSGTLFIDKKSVVKTITGNYTMQK